MNTVRFMQHINKGMSRDGNHPVSAYFLVWNNLIRESGGRVQYFPPYVSM